MSTQTATLVATPTAQRVSERMLVHHEEVRSTLYAERSAAVFMVAAEFAGDQRIVEKVGPIDDGGATYAYYYTRCSEDAWDLLEQAKKYARPAGLFVDIRPSCPEGMAQLWVLHLGVAR